MLRKLKINKAFLKFDLKVSMSDYTSFTIDLSEYKIDSITEIILNFNNNVLADYVRRVQYKYKYNSENKKIDLYIWSNENYIQEYLDSIEFIYYSKFLDRIEKLNKILD